MDSSSSRNRDGSSQSFHRDGPRFSESFHGGGPGFVCKCELPIRVRISNSEKNPNRRYMNCPRSSAFACKFFLWLDPPNLIFFENAPPEVDIDVERQKRFRWIGECARLEQQVDGAAAKNKDLELKLADLKYSKKKMKKELLICRFVICSLFILLVALKLG